MTRSTLSKLVLGTLVAAGGFVALMGATPARADGGGVWFHGRGFGVGISLGAPVFYPAPVVAYPAPVAVCPAPIAAYPYPYYGVTVGVGGYGYGGYPHAFRGVAGYRGDYGYRHDFRGASGYGGRNTGFAGAIAHSRGR